MCYRIASNFLMFYKFDIPVDSIEIKSELEGCVNVLMDSPSENFTEDSFNGKAGQMLEINKICLYEKLRSFAVTILAGVGAEFKYRRRKLPHRWYYFKTNSKGEYYICLLYTSDAADDL